MKANWMRITVTTLVLIALAAGCAPRTLEPGVYHPNGRADQTVKFMSDGTVVFSHRSGATEVEDDEGYYWVSGNRVMFSDGNYCGSDDGSYTWGFDGSALKLTALREAREDRKGSLTAAELLRE